MISNPPPMEVSGTEITQRGILPPQTMAEEVVVEINLPSDEHDSMPFRLIDIQLDKEFGNLHPLLGTVDQLRREWKFQFRLLKHEWGQAHFLTFLTGLLAFLLGSISIELFGGGDPNLTGTKGMSEIGGFAFFQIIASTILWVWFFVQISVNFPIMRGHIINIMIIWGSVFTSQIILHVNSPKFPIGASLGDALGGVILLAIGFFLTYFFWKAVTETRDLHVMEHHVHTDVRVMEEAMSEHSLYSWTVMVGLWVLTLLLNSWSGAHFIADRTASNYPIFTLHIVTGIILIYLLMHMIWFPQRMLGEGTRVQTRAATAADANLLMDGVVLVSEGECPSCNENAPISRNQSGDTVVDCASEDCSRRGPAGNKCEGCAKNFPTRHTCGSCGINSPASDFIPDSEAW